MQDATLRLTMLVCSAEQDMKRQRTLVEQVPAVRRYIKRLTDEQINRVADGLEIGLWSGQVYSYSDAMHEVVWMADAAREGRDCVDELLRHSRPKPSVHDYPSLACDFDDDNDHVEEEEEEEDYAPEAMDETHPDWDFYKPDL